MNKSVYQIIFLNFLLASLFLFEKVAANLWLLLPIIIFFASRNNISSIFWLVVSQIIVTIPELPLTLTQVFILFWITNNITFISNNLKQFLSKNIRLFFLLLFISLLTALYLYNFKYFLELAKNIIAILLAIKIYKDKISPLLISIIVASAAFIAALPFFLKQWGVDIIMTSLQEKGTHFREGASRFAALGDFNYIGMTIAISFAIALLIFVSRDYTIWLKKESKIFYYFFSVSVFISPISILVTLSRGAILSFITALIGVFISTKIFNISRNKLLKINNNVIIILLIIVAIGIPILINNWSTIDNYWTALVDYQKNESSNNLLYSRDKVFSRAIEGFKEKPFTGFVDNSWEPYYAHNNYLDAASYSGIFGLIIYTIITIIPFILFIRTKQKPVYLPLIVTYFFTWFITLSLSVYSLKTFWMLWAMCLLYLRNIPAIKIKK